MTAWLGTGMGTFLGLTVMVMGACAFLMGEAIAQTWRPGWQVVLYGLMLGALDRFLTHTLFKGSLLSPTGYVTDTAVLLAIALFAYRLVRVRLMVRQYPWLFERTGLLSYGAKGPG